MNFQRGKKREEPEINLIPMIDVLLVILIFMMTTTTFDKLSELQINLPQAQADKPQEQKSQMVQVAVDKAGQYLVNDTPVTFSDIASFGAALQKAAQGKQDAVVVISADALATHQSVVNVMEAARQVGLVHITFATQAPAAK